MLLAVDTSTRTVGVALYDGVQVLCETVWTSHNQHTVELAFAVKEALEHTRRRITDVEALGVALGPGSFTGLRVGLALVKGIALALHCPILGVPSLDALAAAQPLGDHPLIAVLQAGRGRLAVGWYTPDKEGWQPCSKVEILVVRQLARRIQEPTAICGELNEEERRILKRKHKNVLLASPAQALRRPSYLAELAWKRWQAGKVDDAASLSPIYLHFGEPIPG